MSLPVIQGTNPDQILEFFKNGYVKKTLDKLAGKRGDLTIIGKTGTFQMC